MNLFCNFLLDSLLCALFNLRTSFKNDGHRVDYSLCLKMTDSVRIATIWLSPNLAMIARYLRIAHYA